MIQWQVSLRCSLPWLLVTGVPKSRLLFALELLPGHGDSWDKVSGSAVLSGFRL